MCGIVGFNWDDKILVKCMANQISHRGPDRDGFFNDKNVSLGHRRLSIIDLSDNGRQPMCNEDGTIWISFNGEIYNFKEIKKKLESKGHEFKSNTDTEVIIHAYEEYGESCVNLFNGMFEFAIWDSDKKCIMLARDRLGIKPLYYIWKDNNLLFASEIKAFLKYSEFKPNISKKVLNYYLTYRYNHLSETIFDTVKKLPPGCLLINHKSKISIKKYWDLKQKPHKNYATSKKEIISNLKRSVDMRLMSDVPLGIYLSGGMDSNSIVSIVNNLGKEDVNTFSVGFGSEGHSNELDYARFTADYYNTNHHELIIDSKDVKVLPKVIWHLDEPMADPTAIPVYLLSKFARRHVKVVLSGEGGDELYGGYERFFVMKSAYKYGNMIPNIARTALATTAQHVPLRLLDNVINYVSLYGDKANDKIQQFINSIPDKAAGYNHLNGVFDEKERLQSLQEKYHYKKKITEEINKDYFTKSQNIVSQLTKFEIKTRLVEDLLMKVDKMTMAHGLEGRVPFLDHKLVEHAYNLPSSWKVSGLKTKCILKYSMKSMLPPKITKRKKMHFFVPINNWFSGELKSVTQEKLSDKNISEQGIFNKKYVNMCFDRLKSSPLYYSRQLWTLLVFQMWYDQYNS